MPKQLFDTLLRRKNPVPSVPKNRSLKSDWTLRNIGAVLFVFNVVLMKKNCSHLACYPTYAATYLRATARSAKRILAIVILSVRLSVTTRYQTKHRWDRDSGFHHMIA